MVQRYNEEISLVTNSETPYLEPDVFNGFSEIKAFYSTKLGGVSKKHLFSLNLGFNLGDEKENVLENYKRLAVANNIALENFVAPKQVHETNVYRVYDKDRGNGIIKDNIFSSADGLVTNCKNLYLTVYGADCVVILFYDPVNHAIGTAHAGWRGTVNNIVNSTISLMNKEFGTLAKDLIISIGPSICSDCYEVGPDVSEQFANRYQKAYDLLYDVSDLYKNKTILRPGIDKHSYVNLWLANYVNLLESGALKEHIRVSGLCTKCHSDLLYSHRATAGKRGVQAGFIGLVD